MSFDTTEFRASVRFVQGYRYLDRCGEALIKLENSLHEGWIPTEPTPKGCSGFFWIWTGRFPVDAKAERAAVGEIGIA